MTAALDRQTAKLPLVLAATLAGLGCDTYTGLDRDTEYPIQTSALEYELDSDDFGYRVDIPYIFTNQTGAPVFLVNCGGSFGILLDREENDAWVYAWGPVLPMCLSDAIEIEADATFADTLQVRAGTFGSNRYPQFDVEDPSGTYRIVWTDALSSFDAYSRPFGEEIPLGYRVSNRFTLRR